MLKHFLRELTPPILWRALSEFRTVLGDKAHSRSKAREWEYIPEGWAYAKAHPEVKGWSVPEILEIYKRKWPRFVEMVQGTAPIGVAHESDLSVRANLDSHNTMMSFAYAIALAAQRLESLSILDWGGGIGHYYLLSKALLPGVRIDYHCKDVPLTAEYGAQLFPEEHFYSDESCLERTYDFVMASSSLHYVEDWQRVFAGLARATQGYLYVTRSPFVLEVPSFVFVQRPYAYGYNTEYLGWCLNRGSFLGEARRLGLTLAREFVIGERPHIANAPEQCTYWGFLFRSSGRAER